MRRCFKEHGVLLNGLAWAPLSTIAKECRCRKVGQSKQSNQPATKTYLFIIWDLASCSHTSPINSCIYSFGGRYVVRCLHLSKTSLGQLPLKKFLSCLKITLKMRKTDATVQLILTSLVSERLPVSVCEKERQDASHDGITTAVTFNIQTAC